MNKVLIKLTLIVLLVAFAIMAVTGLSFIYGIENKFLGELHKITGIIFICVIVVHIITFRNMIRGFLYSADSKK